MGEVSRPVSQTATSGCGAVRSISVAGLTIAAPLMGVLSWFLVVRLATYSGSASTTT